MTALDLDALDALARQASAGEWTSGYRDGCGGDTAYSIHHYVMIAGKECLVGITRHRSRDCEVLPHPHDHRMVTYRYFNERCEPPIELHPDAAYIAAASPSTLLALTARVRELEAALQPFAGMAEKIAQYQPGISGLNDLPIVDDEQLQAAARALRSEP